MAHHQVPHASNTPPTQHLLPYTSVQSYPNAVYILPYLCIRCHHDAAVWRDIDRNGVHDEASMPSTRAYLAHCTNSPCTFYASDSAYLSPALRLHDMACYQVDEVTTMLWRYQRAIYGAFDYYAILYSEIGGKAEGREGTGEEPMPHIEHRCIDLRTLHSVH